MGAKKKPQETLGASELELDVSALGEEGSLTEVYALNEPPARGDTQKLEDDGSAAQKIVEFLSEKRLV
jgi:electron transfer flavoprotein beta subunit